MDDDAEFVPLEINAIITDAKTMERFAGAFQFATHKESEPGHSESRVPGHYFQNGRSRATGNGK